MCGRGWIEWSPTRLRLQHMLVPVYRKQVKCMMQSKYEKVFCFEFTAPLYVKVALM